MTVDLDETLDRLGKAIDEEQVFFLSTEESLELWNYLADLEENQRTGRDEWSWILTGLSAYILVMVLLFYGAALMDYNIFEQARDDAAQVE